MAETFQLLQQGVDGLVRDLEQSVTRPQQKAAYKCCYECVSDDKKPFQATQECVERCLAPLAQADQVVRQELLNLQARLQNCTARCNERTQSVMQGQGAMNGAASPTVEQLQKQFDLCVENCAKSELANLPALAKRTKEMAQMLGGRR